MMTSQPLVDCHFHVFDAGVAVASARYRPSYAAPLTDWLAMAGVVGGAHGDPYGVVVQTSFLGTDNSMMLAALGRMPARLRGVAVVDPSVPDAGLTALDAAGVRGIRLNLYGDEGWRRIETAPWRGLFSRTAALGWHVELHTDNGDGATILSALDAAIGDAPAPIVLDHFGRPGAGGVADAVFDTARAVRERRPLWVKISAPYRLGDGLTSPGAWQALTTRWAEVAGADRLLWGSDWPWTNHEGPARADECRATMAWLATRPDLEDRLRWRNAAALYGFDIPG
ncbi:amidohydrolase family protein [Cupriavidus plantarum]|uniref:amidohydrolase family protein n=1 Tax=Cupriavidus plantarum TaxID=942865 RepID=UPI000F10B812|nr:amidohydrolase family protein [Cupriavidus plantarum]RLK38904.1 putative TIM-barrel fold metal-dependent hydrolase [Cupriavidus plantarum]